MWNQWHFNALELNKHESLVHIVRLNSFTMHNFQTEDSQLNYFCKNPVIYYTLSPVTEDSKYIYKTQKLYTSFIFSEKITSEHGRSKI